MRTKEELKLLELLQLEDDDKMLINTSRVNSDQCIFTIRKIESKFIDADSQVEIRMIKVRDDGLWLSGYFYCS